MKKRCVSLHAERKGKPQKNKAAEEFVSDCLKSDGKKVRAAAAAAGE